MPRVYIFVTPFHTTGHWHTCGAHFLSRRVRYRHAWLRSQLRAGHSCMWSNDQRGTLQIECNIAVKRGRFLLGHTCSLPEVLVDSEPPIVWQRQPVTAWVCLQSRSILWQEWLCAWRWVGNTNSGNVAVRVTGLQLVCQQCSGDLLRRNTAARRSSGAPSRMNSDKELQDFCPVGNGVGRH